MKRILLALTGCLFALAASAQTIHEGSIFINPALTNLGYNSISLKVDGEKNSISRLGLQANGGYAIQDDLAIMGGIGLQNASLEDSAITLFNITAGARKYFIPGFFGGANLVLGTLSMNNKMNAADDDDAVIQGGKSKGHTFGVELNAGYTYYLSKHFAVEPSVSFMYGLSTKIEDEKVNLSVFTLNIGFVYLLDNVISFKNKPAPRKK